MNFLQTTKKEAFLGELLGKGRYKYGRYRGLPLRYAGGKSLGVGHVIEHIPEGVDTLVSPFFGGGAIEIASARELGLRVVGYDIFYMLTNYWHCQMVSPLALAEEISTWEPTKVRYAKVREASAAALDGSGAHLGQIEPGSALLV